MSKDMMIGYENKKLNYQSAQTLKNEETGPDGKPYPKMVIDGQSVVFRPGDTIMNAAERAGLSVKIPRYCYHPGLSVAGTCRMCTVEIEKAPKLMTSCSTPATEGMVVHTGSAKVNKSRSGVMEFLLGSHPLDCPVCDKAGECELQDYNFEYGPATSRCNEDKRVYKEATTKKLSDKITLNMNRCVHCERCMRFGNEVTETFDLLMINRGWKKELTTTEPEKGLVSDYQGCLADVCPVGALTFNDFRFQKRSWFLSRKPSLCDGCSKGCNIEVHSEQDVIYRMMPRYNEKVNGHWMCDEGRASYHGVSNPERIGAPLAPYQGMLHATSWDTVIQASKTELQKAKKVTVVIATDATTEEAKLLTGEFSKLTKAAVEFRSYNGTCQQDEKLDKLLRMKDKTPNSKGLAAQGLKALSDHDLDSSDLVLYVRFGRAGIPTFKPNNKIIFSGVYTFAEVKKYMGATTVALLPGLATAEKTGSFVNCDGVNQCFVAAINHKGQGLGVAQILALLKT